MCSGFALAFFGLLQWDFHLGGASAAGKVALGPLGGVGSGPKVEEMLEAMDSWSGLCLHYRYCTVDRQSSECTIFGVFSQSNSSLCAYPLVVGAFASVVVLVVLVHLQCNAIQYNAMLAPQTARKSRCGSDAANH